MSKRQSIYTDAFAHSNPIPTACRMGDLVMTGIINGIEPGKASAGSLETQCALMFTRVREVIEAAGGTTDHIIKINIAVADLAQRESINVEWVKMFPDPHNRPVRQTTQAVLDRGKLIQCDIVARITD